MAQTENLKYFVEFLVSEVWAQKTFNSSCVQAVIDIIVKEPKELRTLQSLIQEFVFDEYIQYSIR